MKNKFKLKPVMRIFVFLFILILLAIGITIGLLYYVFSIPEPKGLSLASWPNTFTDNFSAWMKNDNGALVIEDFGIKRLDEYGLWIQVIDEAGQEVFSHNKPENYPTIYSASKLMKLETSSYENGNTIFVSSFEDGSETWDYIVGFPYDIGKYMLYYNGENVGRLSPVFRITMLSALCAILLAFLIYSYWLTRHLGKITKGLENISLRTYAPIINKGIFSSIYEALNKMDIEIKHSDKLRNDTERVRREWIANITHDLKTPLSPVKGYAELLADCAAIDSQTVQEYSSIILKNVNYVEHLINDLKLTYQLESGAIPYSPQKVILTHCLKELVIDILNDPSFSGSDIAFESDFPELQAAIDPNLFRRAFQNIVVNSLVHNPPNTKVTISITAENKNTFCIFVRDNGIGMSDEERENLFNRYYRGTNTKEKTEGSGLGLAITNQIVALHSGNITVKSKQGEGTEVAIHIPIEND